MTPDTCVYEYLVRNEDSSFRISFSLSFLRIDNKRTRVRSIDGYKSNGKEETVEIRHAKRLGTGHRNCLWGKWILFSPFEIHNCDLLFYDIINFFSSIPPPHYFSHQKAFIRDIYFYLTLTFFLPVFLFYLFFFLHE